MSGMRLVLAVLPALLLSGCIPRSPAFPGGQEPAAPPPRIEGEFGTLFDEAPVWESNPVQPNASAIDRGVYIVRSGDTLSQIGEASGVGLSALATANQIEPPYAIRVGQRIIIPEGRFHSVAAGETGIAIARAYGVPWSQIIEANALEEPFILKVGQRLAIPGAVSDNSIDQSRAAAFRLDIEDILTGGEPAGSGSLSVDDVPDTPTGPLPATVRVAEPTSFSGIFSWPVSGSVRNRYGVAGEGQVNDGIDIAVAQRAPVLSAGDGVVAFVGDGVTGYDGVILVRHGGGWISAYGRTAQANVTRGQSVKRGQLIGYSGTGSAPLIHFELRKNRVPVDPLKQLPPR